MYQQDMHRNMHQQNMQSVSTADIDARVNFIRRTYAHLLGAVVAFIGLEFALFQVGIAEPLAGIMMMGGQVGWLVVLGLFMLVGWLANKWAMSDASKGMQYLGLGLYVVAQGVIFIPLLYIAVHFSGPAVIPAAGFLTLLVFAGLTVSVFITKKDFSFLRGGLSIAMMIALGAIVAAAVFNFELPVILFSSVMVAVASGYVLYYTSNVLHHYRTDQHVAASLALFSAVALLFWYILQLVMSFSSD